MEDRISTAIALVHASDRVDVARIRESGALGEQHDMFHAAQRLDALRELAEMADQPVV